MPTGSLYDELRKAVDAIVDKRAGSGIAQPAPVSSVSEDGTVMAQVDGKIVRAQMATEEPLLAGEQAWVSKTKDQGYIVHGGVH